jgi:glycosyltransferase involved in cell wall biosynthesis
MPFLNEAAHLADVLATLAVQEFDCSRLFLIAVDNGSTDGGGELVRRWLAGGPIAGVVVSEPRRSIPRALNAGIAQTNSEDIVVRLDAHTLYGPEYVSAIVAAFERYGDDVWCVGGAPAPATADSFDKALHGALFTNPLGLGPADFRSSPGERVVSTVYLGAWRPGVLQRLRGFDERWGANEDCELTERIRASGGTIVRIPLDMRKIMNRGAAAAARQWGRYGYWRAQTLKRYPAAIRLRHAVPPLALLAGGALLASPARLTLVPLAVAYAAAIVWARDRREPPAVTAASLVFFPLLHTLYAGGLILGALHAPKGS